MDPPTAKSYRRGFRRTLLALLPLAVLVGASGLAAANGPNAIYAFNDGQGHFVLPSYDGLLSTNPIYPGTTVFGDIIYLQITGNGVNSTVVVKTTQTADGQGNLYSNITVPVAAENVTSITLTLPSSTTETTTKLCVGSGCVTFAHLTPITLFPSGIVNVGGVDLLALSITVETAVLAFPATVLARYLTRKALWTPRARMELILPHVVLAIVLLIGFDYQAFDEALGGVEFLLFPVVFVLLFFFWALHLFNVARPVEILRPDPQGGHRLRYNRWRIFMGTRPDGSVILVGAKWRDWLARLFGHAPILVEADTDGSKRGAPAVAPLRTLRSEGERREPKPRRFKGGARHETPFDDFVIATEISHKERDPPTHLLWVDSDKWLSTAMPYLSVHRNVVVPPKLSPEGAVIVPATERRKLTWPHYIDPPTVASLAEAHYWDAPVAALGWVSAQNAYRRVNDLRVDNHALRVTVFTSADEAAQAQVAEVYRLIGRERFALTDEEASADARSEAPKATAAKIPSEQADASPRPSGVRARDAGVNP